jgi:hypothetical protein
MGSRGARRVCGGTACAALAVASATGASVGVARGGLDPSGRGAQETLVLTVKHTAAASNTRMDATPPRDARGMPRVLRVRRG